MFSTNAIVGWFQAILTSPIMNLLTN